MYHCGDWQNVEFAEEYLIMFRRLSCSRVNDATILDDVADDVMMAAELVNEVLPAAHITTHHEFKHCRENLHF